MNNIEDRDKPYWFVMYAYKQEQKAEEILSALSSIKYYIPKHFVVKTVKGRKEKRLVPYINSIVFIYSSFTDIVKFKERYDFIKFVIWNKSTGYEYLIVPDEQMETFIRVSSSYVRQVRYCNINELDLQEGTRVRVIGGEFDGVEGRFMRVKGRRSKQVVLTIPNVMAVSVEVHPDLIEVLE